jgi:hypothetical protein
MCHYLSLVLRVLTTKLADLILQYIIPASIERVDTAVRLLEDHASRLGTAIREYWVISAANAVVQSRGDQAKLDQILHSTVENVVLVLKKILKSQEKEISWPTPQSTTSTVGHTDGQTVGLRGVQGPPMTSMNLLDVSNAVVGVKQSGSLAKI